MRTPLINVEILDVIKNVIEYSKNYNETHPFNIWNKNYRLYYKTKH